MLDTDIGGCNLWHVLYRKLDYIINKKVPSLPSLSMDSCIIVAPETTSEKKKK